MVLDEKKIKKIIDEVLYCSCEDLPIGQQCSNDECINCGKNRELKKRFGCEL